MLQIEEKKKKVNEELNIFSCDMSCNGCFVNWARVFSRDCWLVVLARFPRSLLPSRIEKT